MSVIEQVRREREDLARVLKNHKGIRKSFEELYPDTAHFIYELLQNAEDTSATEVIFHLVENCLAFEHNGRPFDVRDIRAITDYGEGTKAADEDMIGCFGVGFKAIFAYCETPHIWCPTYSFKITDLVLPSELVPNPELDGRTRFEFPFNNPKKSCESAYAEVKVGLSDIAETTLLFLTHLESIRWTIDGVISGQVRRVQHSTNHFEVIKEIGGKVKARSHFLKFDQPVEGLERQHIAVAFRLDFVPNIQQFDPKKPIAKQLKIVPAAPGTVAVYFLAKNEKSGLRFHLHAPFKTDVSRANIKDSPANEPLFRQLAELTAASLHQIRDLGLLTAEFLAALPNPHDSLPDKRYECIPTAIVKEMNTQPLTPTYGGSHAPAKYLLQAKNSLKKLLPENDIKILVSDKKKPQWAVGATPKESAVDRFLEGLAIQKWDIEEFVELLRTKASQWSPDDDFIAWLSKKTMEWHQELYALLQKELEANEDLDTLSYSKIVRLWDGSYSVGDGCFFPSDGIEQDDALPRVDAATYTSGKNKTQQKNARSFLERVGVREVAEADEVQAILKLRYADDDNFPDDKTYRKDLKRFIALVEKEPDNAALFNDYFILQCKDYWRKPGEIFVDDPFLDSGLRHYYKALGKNAGRFAMMDDYTDYGIPIKRLIKFVEAIGAQVKLEIVEQTTVSHPLSEELREDYLTGNVKRSGAAIDDDWTIPDLEKVLRKPSMQLSQTIWKTVQASEPHQLEAQFRPNLQFEPKRKPSSLVLSLKKMRWIPQKDGKFVRPADASRDLLPTKGFAFDAGYEWLKAIGFEENVAGKSEERRQKQAAAKKLGFSGIQELEHALTFAKFPREERERILANHKLEAVTEPTKSDDRKDDRKQKSKRSPDSDGEADQDIAENGTSDNSGTESRKKGLGAKGSRRFFSFVPTHHEVEEPDPDGLDHQTRMKLEERALQVILEKEPNLKRTPTNNPGFDLFEEGPNGERIRWVEVKAMTGCLQDREVGMSHTQFNWARDHGDAYSLYVVEYASDDNKCRILRIKDPAGKAKTFTFDRGWIDVAEPDDS